MSGKTKNTVITVVALVLIAVALFLGIQLVLGEEGVLFGEGKTEPHTEEATTQPTTAYQGLIPIVKSKYLWEYGWQQIANERPSEIPKEEEPASLEEVTTVYVPQTYYEPVTNWRGDTVTDEFGSEVTEVRTVPRTETFTEIITGEDGEALTDEAGNIVTEVHTQIVTTTQAPIPVTDENGEAITDEAGNVVTETTTLPQTTGIVSGNSTGSGKQWAQGIVDGKKYVYMKVYLDGEYTINSRSVMTMTVREKGGFVSMPETFTYNLSSGTCSVSPTKKYEQMAYVKTDNGQTVVTLMIPEDVRPDIDKTTAFSAKSTYSTFRDVNGEKLPEFTVTVL